MKKKLTPNLLFFILSAVSISVFLIEMAVSGTTAGSSLFFGDTRDSFMDFFNVLACVATGRPFDCGGLFIYPPFVGIIMFPFMHLIPYSVISSNMVWLNTFTEIPIKYTVNLSKTMRLSQAGLMSLVLFFLLAIIAVAFLVSSLYNGKSGEKKFLVFVVLLSGGFLFEYERANTIILAVIFLLIFIWLKDSKNAFLRELALIALACAAGIKVYPAVFGLLLIRDKRWKDAIRTVIYGALVMFLPFLLFGGRHSIKLLYETLKDSNTGTFSTGLSYKVDLTNALRTLGMLFGWSDKAVIDAGGILSYALALLAIVPVCTVKKEWKAVSIVALAVVLTPAFNFYYALSYLVIPLILFLKTKESEKGSYVYAILFAILLSPAFIGTIDEINQTATGAYGLSAMSMMQNILLVVLYISLIAEGWVQFMRNRMKKPAISDDTAALSQGNPS